MTNPASGQARTSFRGKFIPVFILCLAYPLHWRFGMRSEDTTLSVALTLILLNRVHDCFFAG